MERRQTASIIITGDTAKALLQAAGSRQLFLTSFGAFDYSDLSTRYFMFRDTASVYEVP
jgi:hypothetical protein